MPFMSFIFRDEEKVDDREYDIPLRKSGFHLSNLFIPIKNLIVGTSRRADYVDCDGGRVDS